MISDAERIRAVFNGGHVRRWHATDIIGEERVDSHTWGMLALIYILNPAPSPELLKAVTFHDSPAELFGDFPHPSKRAFPAVGAADKEIGERVNRSLGFDVELTPEDNWWLSFVDMAQAYLFCVRQVAQGNKLMAGKMNDCDRLVWAMTEHQHAAPGAAGHARDIIDSRVDRPLSPDLTVWEQA